MRKSAIDPPSANRTDAGDSSGGATVPARSALLTSMRSSAQVEERRPWRGNESEVGTGEAQAYRFQ